jgi:hypothetical protein
MALIALFGEDPLEVLPPIKVKNPLRPENPSLLAIMPPTVENTGENLND